LTVCFCYVIELQSKLREAWTVARSR